MKSNLRYLLLLLPLLALQSCFKDEEPGAECDIEEASLAVSNPDEVFFHPTDAQLTVASTDSVITFNVRSHADLTAMAPQFKLSEGATISPESGSTHDFSAGPVTYVVTSEDGAWHRTYRVGFNKVITYIRDTINYDFEHFELEAGEHKYYVWHNVRDDGTLGSDWASGNPGFRLSMGNAPATEYPTVPLRQGYEGCGVQLTTRDTGPFGAMVNKRIAAGNLFLGSFDLQTALMNPKQATRFGVPFTKHPAKLMGYYTFQPGAKFQDENGLEVAGKTDEATIYAVLYRNHDAHGQALTLHGDNTKTSPQVVALAEVKDIKATNKWTPFEVEFDYREPIDDAVLADRGYSLAIVFSSSAEGADFRGAIGSTLCVDKVSITCRKEE